MAILPLQAFCELLKCDKHLAQGLLTCFSPTLASAEAQWQQKQKMQRNSSRGGGNSRRSWANMERGCGTWGPHYSHSCTPSIPSIRKKNPSIRKKKKKGSHCWNPAASHPSGNNSVCPAFGGISWRRCRVSSERARALVISFSYAAACFHLIKKADL